MTQIVAITLDLDDTLWPMRPVLIEAERALAQWLREHAPKTADLFGSQQRAQLRARILADNPARAHDVSFIRRAMLSAAMQAAGEPAALAEPAFQVFYEARQRVTPFEDVLPVLARWAGRYQLVAVSNGNASLERIGLADYFSARIAAHELDFAKPDPRIFHEACRKIGVPPDRVLHVGDDLRLDVHAARAAGLKSAWIQRPGIESPEPSNQHEQAEPRFRDLAELDRHLHSVDIGP